MTLILSPDTERRLRVLATRRGQTPEELADALVLQAFTESDETNNTKTQSFAVTAGTAP